MLESLALVSAIEGLLVSDKRAANTCLEGCTGMAEVAKSTGN